MRVLETYILLKWKGVRRVFKKISLVLLIATIFFTMIHVNSQILHINILSEDNCDPWGPKSIRIAQDMDDPWAPKDNIVAFEVEDPWNPKVIKLG